MNGSFVARLLMAELSMMGVAMVTTLAGVLTYLRIPISQNKCRRIPNEGRNNL